MNEDILKNWFKSIEFLPENSVIVMDNAPYRSVKLSRFPNTSWQKCEIVNWLRENKINFDNNFVKAELLRLANTVKNDTNTSFNKYIIDERRREDDSQRRKATLCYDCLHITV